MAKKDKRIDIYIGKSEEFAKPILNHLRELVHRGCPEIEETIKWGFPHFDYHGILCSMASFRHHCSFGFWKSSLMTTQGQPLAVKGETAMGNFGRVEKLSDLPNDKMLLQLIAEAARLNQEGIKIVRKPRSPARKTLKIPNYFRVALAKNKSAAKTYEAFSYSNKKEYVDWVTEAKTDETRKKRLGISIEWMAKGKTHNWKYEMRKKPVASRGK